MSAISLVMPCYNRAHDLQRILAAYDRQVGQPDFELIAIDDASSDATQQLLTSFCPQNYRLRTEQQPTNQGPAAARNLGVSLAQAPLIAFVGDDIRPDPHFVQAHLEAHRRYPEPQVAILGRVTWPPDMPQNTLMKHIDGVGAQQFSYHYMRNQQTYDFRHLYTANVSLKTEFIKRESHWFDTDFPYAAIEDAEFAYRLSQQGLRIIYDSRPLGYHYHYHTIWTFSVRQYRAGLMVWEFVKKHPDLANFLRVTKTKSLGWLGPVQRLSCSAVQLSEVAHWLETQTVRLTSAYEWQPHDLLDEFYLNVLEYFWRKGLIDGTFERSSRRESIRDAYAIYYLKPRLTEFLQQAQRLRIPAPGLDLELLNRKLAPLESRLVNRLQRFWRTTGHHWAKPWLTPEVPPS